MKSSIHVIVISKNVNMALAKAEINGVGSEPCGCKLNEVMY
ncbi:hypothetical protein Vdis_1908 [Vulcanisaeta distributa DSM 14429]|uniref:Uncharacterized protein n=1 Tax=Vulcanisaeta distributa (strain DSM 14429 / JCM 11212 / NBRC 100878 / IC-017) TaxID=572478 RepID=E1QNJ2_VULDI|nr:hypothetical protein Vdis_1908 [Vulcanisaeta distributa DSM 14429]